MAYQDNQSSGKVSTAKKADAFNSREPTTWEKENLDPKDLRYISTELPAKVYGYTQDSVLVLTDEDVTDVPDGFLTLRVIPEPTDDPETGLFLAYKTAVQSGKV